MKRGNMKLDLSLDYHAHILPGCDHGSDGLATSLKQVEMAASAGVKTICATPHFYPHKESVESFLRRRKKTAGLLLRELPENAPLIQLGAEVLICDGMERMDGLNRLCREGTNELLLEMPFYAWPESIWDTLYLLCDLADIQIVLAHAERYAFEHGEQGDLFVQKAPAATIETLAQAVLELKHSNLGTTIIGTRHGEKLFEVLVTAEEMMRAEELPGFFRIPADNRDLNYDNYFSKGNPEFGKIEQYTSHNTHRLNVEEMKQLLLKLKLFGGTC